jgi:hypothetical protein
MVFEEESSKTRDAKNFRNDVTPSERITCFDRGAMSCVSSSTCERTEYFSNTYQNNPEVALIDFTGSR